MMCDIHNKWFPQPKCPLCEKEKRVLDVAVAMAEIENAKPIEVWRGDRI